MMRRGPFSLMCLARLARCATDAGKNVTSVCCAAVRTARGCAAVSTFVFGVALTVFPALALAFQPPTGQAEFVPAKNLPQTEQMPAGPLLLTAYAFIWVAVAFYVWTLWRRLNKVEQEMGALAQKTSRR